MSVTQNWTHKLVLMTTVAAVSIAMMSCCKKLRRTEVDPVPPREITEPTATQEAPPTPSVVEDWKTKCPGAVNEEKGSVELTRASQIYKERDTNGEKLHKLDAGTWVNLLGSVETWTCIDYPCAPGKLCPGWVETRDVQREAADTRKDTRKDTSKDAGKPDTGKPDAGQDSSTPPATSRGENLIRVPGMLIGKDGGLLRPGRPILRGE